MTDYERIKKTCLEKEELWEDPDFPANQSSVFYFQTPPFHFEWKRSKEIYQKPSFIHDRNEVFDVVPGKLGDKWMVSCLGVLYLTKGLFYRVVPADQRVDETYAGVFRFRLWWCGQWLEVLVDDRLPTVNGKLAFLQSHHTEQMWPALLEKAYAKLHGSYEALKYGSLLDGLSDLTGGITESLQIEMTTAESLKSLLKSTSLVTAHHVCTAVGDKIPELKTEMNYVILNVEQVESTKGPVHVVRMRRPIGIGEVPVPYIVLNTDAWHAISPIDRDRIISTPKGTWMLFSDFQRAFLRVEVVHLDSETCRAEPFLADKQMWQMKMHQSGWKRGVSAGGCRNYVHFFHTNPQIQITLPEPDTVIISLNQHCIMEPKVIGFSIYKISAPLEETAKALFFRKVKSTINSQYTNSRQVTYRSHLSASTYIIMPTTFEPRDEANFTLRIFTSKPISMKVLDNLPKMTKTALVKAPPVVEVNSFAQYEAVFLQLADEHKTIDPFELQELLDACLPNDYIKSCASIDTCRQIVLSLDKKGIGRISLSDFKDLMCSLKHWQLVFRTHAREKMGVLRAERFRDALCDVGFVVPEKVMHLLVLRYMRKDGMLRFGDFVSAVMHLHRAFEIYRKNLRTEAVQMSLTEWLKNVFMC
ncbi:calpain-C isoform X2 [Trichoplusia ni]|uniref:Calpain-C isoform X2 n=1 Tax=Trichoplusia ni TaxID=7111 RepID=A0A7E5X2Z9_TRINI|nr:calpain-C isoform X2 [Trichoplusia ni]